MTGHMNVVTSMLTSYGVPECMKFSAWEDPGKI